MRRFNPRTSTQGRQLTLQPPFLHHLAVQSGFFNGYGHAGSKQGKQLERYRVNRGRMQRLAFYSLAELHALRTQYALDYEQATGYLQLFRSEREVEAAATTHALLTELGVRHVLLDATQCRTLESALHPAPRWPSSRR